MKGKDIRDILGKNIKFFRFRRQLSQSELAEKADISITFLSNIERGLQFPTSETLAELAAGLEVNVYELFLPENFTEDNKKTVIALHEDIKKNIVQTVDHIFNEYFK